ncbi:PBECR4 domain-containing protein [Saccharibacillus sacchari]|uniref:PBECR4 domain-containing protein n=1 Tax=Saccharibacillus sacchari TaxID=456493 RepID=A0ACC6PHL0_9BACL
METKKTISFLKTAQHHYDKLLNKEIHYVYKKEGKYHELILKSGKANFAHFFGVKYIDPKTNREFNSASIYSALKKNKLSPEGIKKKADGTTDQKLEVVPSLDQILTCNLRILGNGTYLKLEYDAAIRTSKAIFCIALTQINDGCFAPKSLLNLKSSKSNTIGAGYPVHCVYEVLDDKEIFKYCEHQDFILYQETHTYFFR